MSIKVLDCTLRDGGYLNGWSFGKGTIASILDKLERAGLDIIECGFLTEQQKGDDCSLFDSVAKIKAVLPQREKRAMYVAMIAIGEMEFDPNKLEPYDGSSIEGIRLTFHKAEIDKAFDWAERIMAKGYKVFMQPVASVFYSDMELLKLVERINALRPYAFYIVDTLGSMYRNDVSHRFYVIDKNMSPQVRLGFHGHNNLQLAFSNAQVLGKIQTKRTLILDSSVYGMGRGAGNLPTELITQYINKNIVSKYDVTIIMDIYDEHISHIRKQYEWGYTVPYHIAAASVCHPNYATYLIGRQTLTMKDIKQIIQSIPPKSKILYDKALIEQLYTQYQSKDIDDGEAIKEISRMIKDRDLLLLAPGKSLVSEYDKIMDYIKTYKPFVISVNFIDPRYKMNACFVSNHKRMDGIMRQQNALKQVRLILSSNIPGGSAVDSLYVDYKKYTNDDMLISDSAGLMLLKLLKQCGADKVTLAGFDGFAKQYGSDYYMSQLNLSVNEAEVDQKLQSIRRELGRISSGLKIAFLTRSLYQDYEKVT